MLIYIKKTVQNTLLIQIIWHIANYILTLQPNFTNYIKQKYMIGYRDRTLKYYKIYFNDKLERTGNSIIIAAKGKLMKMYIYWSKS